MRTDLPWILLACLLAHAGNAASTQLPAGRIEGHVVDPNGRPIRQAYVTLVPTSLATLTDRIGYFAFPNVQPGRYGLRITHVAFETRAIEDLTVRTSEIATPGTIRLELRSTAT